ncbi:unnamed protein product [Paramecium octaurelia]|uniref:Uncharacterized protein n=1 Tax=Paramecium octaurelia TaxID=43137 RepID=A0A8S1X6B4_PAROT|nr:unnamed protein product [Paramecium octaurelia]
MLISRNFIFFSDINYEKKTSDLNYSQLMRRDVMLNLGYIHIQQIGDYENKEIMFRFICPHC